MDKHKQRRIRDTRGTRELLLTAGTEVFAERGYDGARIDAIADRAGVNRALVSYHFGGKRGLYQAIIGSTIGTAVDRLAAVRESDAPAEERLRRFIEVFTEAAARRPAFPTMLIREVISGGAHLAPEMLPKFLEAFLTVRLIVEAGVRRGEFRPVDPLLTHLNLVGGMLFFFAARPFRDRLRKLAMLGAEPSAAALAEHLVTLMSAGLSAGGSR